MKKLISIFLLVAMLISMIPCVAAEGETKDTTTTTSVSVTEWTAKTDHTTHDVTAGRTYTIDSPEELKKYAEIMSGNARPFCCDTILLTADIDLNEGWDAANFTQAPGYEWPDIDTDDQSTGIFDGQDHTIRGVYQVSDTADKSGIFGRNWGRATVVKNVKFENCYSESSATSGHGFLYGTLTNTADVTIENVSFKNCYSKSAAGTSYGFLCGKVTTNATKLTVKNVSFENCHSESSATSGSGQGFLCGTVTETAEVSIENVSIKNCSSTSSVAIGQGSLCGVVNAGSTVKVNNVYVDAEIVNKSTIGNVDGIGGLIGGMPWMSGYGLPTVTITNSVFAGSIEVKPSSDFRVIGGLIGAVNSGGVTVTNSASYAKFARTEDETTTASDLVLVGGIIGYQRAATYNATVDNCISACTNGISGAAYGSVLGAGLYTSDTKYATITGTGNVTTSTGAAVGCAWSGSGTTYYDSTTEQYKAICSKGIEAQPATANSDNFATVLHGYQTRATGTDAFDFRLVATVDIPEGVTVDKVGFVIGANYGTTTLTKNYSTDTVYTAVKGNTETGLVEYDVETLGGDYIFALAIAGAPVLSESEGRIELIVTTYYVSGTTTVYGATEVFTVTAPQDALN